MLQYAIVGAVTRINGGYLENNVYFVVLFELNVMVCVILNSTVEKVDERLHSLLVP